MFDEVLKQILNRPASSHKYDFGQVMVVGGSPGMVGAPLLAGKAALRIGAGLVTIASAPDVVDKLERRVEEIMTLRIEKVSDLTDFIKDRKVNSLIIGPGLKPNDKLVLEILEKTDLPTVIDGGALTILANVFNSKSPTHLHWKLNKSSFQWILTPHLGEFQRFFDKPLPSGSDRLRSAVADFAKRHGVVLVLKGHPTLVASPAGEVYENQTGDPALATAGTGDVLSGVISGLIAQDIEPSEAAKAGVYLHGLAGDIASKTKTEAGVIASDVIEVIPKALKVAFNHKK